MPVRLREWLQNVVKDPIYRNLIWWNNEKLGKIAIHWKHASYEDYGEQDSALFKKWAQDNNRYDPNANDSADERKRWKTNFRCALHSATNIRKEHTGGLSHSQKQAYRIYQLLEKPDPEKVKRKKRSNQLAAKSKQKPIHEKRSYNSRLNKTKKVKHEPFDAYDRNMAKSKRSRIASGKPTETKIESMDVHESVQQPTYNTYHCSMPKVEKTELDHLPATLDMFHEEDGGYCSASDSSSVKSLDSGTSPTTAGRRDFEDGYMSVTPPLEPVENILPMARDYYSVGPLPTALPQAPDVDYCSSDISNNVYYMHDTQMYEVSNTSRVNTQMMQQEDFIMPAAMQDPQTDFDDINYYSLTMLD